MKVAQQVQQSIHRRPVGGVLAVVGEAKHTLGVDEEISPQLVRVGPEDLRQRSGSQEPHGVGPQVARMKGAPERTLKLIGSEDLPFGIQQEWEVKAMARKPGACAVFVLEADEEDRGVQRLKFLFPALHERHMLPSVNSSQMPQEDQQHTAALPKRNGE